MSTMRFNFRSQAIGYYVDVTIILPTDNLAYRSVERMSSDSKTAPPKGPEKQFYKPGMKFQTIYFCHGGGDDDSLVYRYTNIERYAQDNMVMVVIPNIPNSFGARACYKRDYVKFITEELPAIVQSMFPSSPAREDNFIMGYAMGGNVALGNAIIAPQNYSMCIDMSGGIGYTLDTATMVAELAGDHFNKDFPLYISTFGPSDKFAGSENDIYPIAKEHVEKGDEMPEFIIMCGSEEFIRSRVEKDVAKLEELGIKHRYIVMEGYTHDFRMWDVSIEMALRELLPLKRKPLYPAE